MHLAQVAYRLSFIEKASESNSASKNMLRNLKNSKHPDSAPDGLPAAKRLPYLEHNDGFVHAYRIYFIPFLEKKAAKVIEGEALDVIIGNKPW